MNWEPWTGCYAASEGCAYCYFYGPYSKRHGQNAIEKTPNYDKPIRRNKKGEYQTPGGKIVATCFATDFFLPEADAWRAGVWAMVKERRDLDFLILTKRIDRFPIGLPEDWGDGYENVNIGCSVENQERADERLRAFLAYPIRRRFAACSPLLGPIDLSAYIHGLDHVTVAGEAGREARLCDYDWALDIRRQCVEAGKTFWFKATGSCFRQEGVTRRVNPYKQGSLAKELDISILNGKKFF